MKHLSKVFLVCALFALTDGAADALELALSGGVGNMAFDSNSERALSDVGQKYAPQIFPFGSMSVQGKYSDLVDFSFRVTRDPLLRTLAIGTVGLDFGFGYFEIGPAAGLLNSEKQPLTAGISGGIRLEYPGIIFGSVKAFSTLATPLNMPGDYIQNSGELALGFWVPNVICAVSINVKSFSLLVSDALFTKDQHLRYQFSADVFNKNVPYTIRLDMGYQVLDRSYQIPGTGGSTKTDELKSLYIGFEGTWQINKSLRLMLGLEMPVYSWTTAPLKKGAGDVFYHAETGIIVTL